MKEPPLVALTRVDVDNFLSRREQPAATADEPPTASALAAPGPSAAALAIANELHSLRMLAAERELPWEDQYVIEWWQRRKVASGVGDSLRPLLARFDEGNARESVDLSGFRYRINPSRPEIKVAILKEAQSILRSTTAAEAPRIFWAWLELRTARENARAQEFRREQKRVLEAYQKAKAEHEATVLRKRAARDLAVTAAGLALGAFMLFGLVLAVLAIERHTRLLEGAQFETRSQVMAIGGMPR